MHKNLGWQALLLVVASAALWFTGWAAYHYYFYRNLTHQIKPTSIEWKVASKSDEEFYLEASYTFVVRGETFQGQTSWPEVPFRNAWAAKQSIPDFSAQHPLIWFDLQNPTHSSLQKTFPLKECISAAVLWVIFIYFLWLGYYVAKFKVK